MRNSCNAGGRPVAAVVLGALILTGTLIWDCIAAVPPATADPTTACGPDQATAVQSAISQLSPPRLPFDWSRMPGELPGLVARQQLRSMRRPVHHRW